MADLQPASKSLVKLNLGLNKIGGSIPAAGDIAQFSVLSELQLYNMELTGSFVVCSFPNLVST
jgi:hypothetical protein